VWLGVRAFARRRELATGTIERPVAPVRSVFIEGFLVGVTNPKTVVFFAAIVPQYIDRHGSPAGLQIMILGVVFVTIALVCDAAWGLAAGSARTWLERSPRRLEVIGAAGGLAVIGLGIRLLFTGRRS
jgi:threonine/homoserine/homoserine lactone efflux protein